MGRRKYAVQFDECENRSKIVVWTPMVASYVDMQGVESGVASAVTYSEAKREVLGDRIETLNHLKAEIKTLRSTTKQQFDAATDKHETDMAAYPAEIAAAQEEADRESREYVAALKTFESGLDSEFNEVERRMAVSLWRLGYWDDGWRPFGDRGAVFDDGNFHAMVQKNSDGQWRAAVWVGSKQTSTPIADGGLPVGIAWVRQQHQTWSG